MQLKTDAAAPCRAQRARARPDPSAQSTLDLISRNPDAFEIVALTAQSRRPSSLRVHAIALAPSSP